MSAERFYMALDALLLTIWEEHRILLSPRVLFNVDHFMEQSVLLRPPVTDGAFWFSAQTAVIYIVALSGRKPLKRSEMLLLKACWRMNLRRILISAARLTGVDYALP